MPSLALLALSMAVACYSVPMPLSEWGDMDVTVMTEGDGTGVPSAKVVPQKGCPTFMGDATLNGTAMTEVSPGQAWITGPAYAPGTTCVGPEFTYTSYGVRTDDGLTFTMTDSTDTWTAADSLAFGWFIVDERELYPAESTVYLALDREVEILSVYVTGGTESEGGYPTLEADESGGYSLKLLPRWTGEVTLWLTANSRFEAETCEGFASCTMEANVTSEVTLQVR